MNAPTVLEWRFKEQVYLKLDVEEMKVWRGKKYVLFMEMFYIKNKIEWIECADCGKIGLNKQTDIFFTPTVKN